MLLLLLDPESLVAICLICKLIDSRDDESLRPQNLDQEFFMQHAINMI